MQGHEAVRRLLKMLPIGAVIIIGDERRRFTRLPEIDESLVTQVTLPDVHRYIDDKFAKSLSGEVMERASLEEGLFDTLRFRRLYVVHVDEFLAGLKGGQGLLRLDSLSNLPCAGRATLQLAQEIMMRESESK